MQHPMILSSSETPMLVPRIVSPEKLPIPTLVPSSGIATTTPLGVSGFDH